MRSIISRGKCFVICMKFRSHYSPPERTVRYRRASFHHSTLRPLDLSTLSSLFHHSTIPLFHYSNIPSFHYSIFPLFHYSIIPLFHHSTIPLFHYFIVAGYLFHKRIGMSGVIHFAAIMF